MTLAIEILKDGSEVTYESDDIDEYDDLVCISDDNLPPIDLTKVKDVDIEAERVNSEVAYKEIISDSRSFAKGYHYTQTRSYEPVSVEHSIYYACLKFEGQRKRRKFVLDEEIVNKIYLIQQDKEFIGKYEPTYHPTPEEIQKQIQDKNNRMWGWIFIVGMVVLIFSLIGAS